MSIMIFTEKKDVACQIASILYKLGEDKSSEFSGTWESIKSSKAGKGYLEGGKYKLTWASGHLQRDLQPQEISDAYQFEFKFNPQFNYLMPNLLSERKKTTKGQDKNKVRQIKIIKELFSKNKFDEIILSTDADAEGEAIGRDTLFDIAKVNPSKVKITRFWITGSFKAEDTIKKALANREPYDLPKYNNLYDSREGRSGCDYAVGLKPKKALVDTYGFVVLTGRVKSVCLGLVGDRELDIKNFKPREYYQIKGYLDNMKLSNFYIEQIDDVNKDGQHVSKPSRTLNYHDASEKDRVINETKSREGVITKLDVRTNLVTGKASRPLPLSGDDFKSVMMKTHKVTLKQAGEMLQYLRDEGFTTYQGTNGRFFALADEEDVKTAYLTAKSYFSKDKIEVESFNTKVIIFDDKKASTQNHPPLHLTQKVPTESDFKKWDANSIPKLKEGYELIAKRILVHFLEDDKFDAVRIEVNINNNLFDAVGERPIKHGWREFVDMKKTNTFLDVGDKHQGDKIKLDKIEAETLFTTKPKLYTEATLLNALMNIGSVIQEKINQTTDMAEKLRLKKAKVRMKVAEGIGTDRTRETIIEELTDSKSKSKAIDKSKKSELTLTDLGWKSFKLLPEKYKSFIYTAELEDKLEAIRNGELNVSAFIKEVNSDIEDIITGILKNVEKSLVIERKHTVIEDTDLHCPVCDSPLVSTDSMFKCSTQGYSNGKATGCKFSVWRENKLFGQIDNAFMKKILKDGKVTVGNKEAVLNLESKYFIEVVSKDDKPAQPPKDLANGLRLEKGRFYLGDKFIYEKVLGNRILSESEAKSLLEGEEIVLKKCISKNQKTYEPTVKLSSSGGVEFAN